MGKKMHETAKRLFEAARMVRPDVADPADLARVLNQSDQTIYNWSYRGKNGVSKDGRLAAQRILGISATWIEDGSGEMFAAADKAPTGSNAAIRDRTSGENSRLAATARSMEGAATLSPAAQTVVDLVVTADAVKLPANLFDSLSAALRVWLNQPGATESGKGD